MLLFTLGDVSRFGWWSKFSSSNHQIRWIWSGFQIRHREASCSALPNMAKVCVTSRELHRENSVKICTFSLVSHKLSHAMSKPLTIPFPSRCLTASLLLHCGYASCIVQLSFAQLWSTWKLLGELCKNLLNAWALTPDVSWARNFSKEPRRKTKKLSITLC